MLDNIIQNIVEEYKKSIIQSEEEVRSKLIVPLINALGYPSYLRAEEFSVYGFEGGKKLGSKKADYILFSDKQFANHRACSKKDLEWVQNHSLLVVEAKKPGEMPEILGQPQYYTIWTKAVAYLAIDGERIKGYFYNSINSDLEVMDCNIEDLPKEKQLWEFSYENIIDIKENGKAALEALILSKYDAELAIESDALALLADNKINNLKEEDLADFPVDSLQYMRDALGKNADNLTKSQLIERFLNTTDAFLQNDLRYGIPSYVFDFPRKTYGARLYIDGMLPVVEYGEVIEFYWNDCERFLYESKHFQIDIYMKNDKLFDFEIGYHVLDEQVSERLVYFKTVKKVLMAKETRVVLEDFNHRMFILPSGKPKKMWRSKRYVIGMCNFWVKGLQQMREIEKFYKINFKLHYITGEENLNELYDAISFVYDGIVLNENCDITLPGGIFDENLYIDAPLLLEENKRLPLKPRFIHGICFEAYESWILPGKIRMKGKKKGEVTRVSGCCRYKIVNKDK